MVSGLPRASRGSRPGSRLPVMAAARAFARPRRPVWVSGVCLPPSSGRLDLRAHVMRPCWPRGRRGARAFATSSARFHSGQELGESRVLRHELDPCHRCLLDRAAHVVDEEEPATRARMVVSPKLRLLRRHLQRLVLADGASFERHSRGHLIGPRIVRVPFASRSASRSWVPMRSTPRTAGSRGRGRRRSSRRMRWPAPCGQPDVRPGGSAVKRLAITTGSGVMASMVPASRSSR